jgi:hypothetical protein
MNRKKLNFASITLLVVLALALTTVSAASVHLKGGKNAEPWFTDKGLTLLAEGELAGLGYENVWIEINALANPTATCTNNGGNQAPGQNPAQVAVTGGVMIEPEDFTKNGNVYFFVETEPPYSPFGIVPNAPDCPNPNWTEQITDLAFTSAVITVEQPVGTLVLTVSCTFEYPTMDGAVSKAMVTCTSE